MSTTYTQSIVRFSPTAAGYNELGVVPDGVLWVVRGLCYRRGSAWQTQLAGGFQVVVDFGTYAIGGVGSADAINGHVYSEELRQVLDAGEHLGALCDRGGWEISVTGYVFSV